MSRTVRLLIWGALAGLGVALIAEALHVEVFGNFHTVIPGRAYRCGQPSAQQLNKMVADHHIRTLINLRGNQSGAPWYTDECRATTDLDVSQEDICLSAGRLPCLHEIKRLVEVLDHCEYPVLFHCQRGADRTGLACAILLLTHTNASLAEAKYQLSPRYGHVPFGKPGQLDRFLDIYEEWLKANGLAHERANFVRWLDEGFTEYAAQLELIESPQIVKAQDPSLFVVRARNTSTRSWEFNSGRTAGFHALFSIHGPTNEPVYRGRAGLFDATVGPGESIDLKFVVPSLKQPGRYRMLVDMTDERFCLFYQIGSEPLVVEFEVQ